MYGAVIGDIIGSYYEWHNVKKEDFELFSGESHFTDDTVLTCAIAESILNMGKSLPRKCYATYIKAYYKRYPYAGFGQMFKNWAEAEELTVQRSYGNGAAMRVSAIGWAFESEKEVLKQVYESCYYTHKNREAIRHARAVAIAVFLARKGMDKTYIKKKLERDFRIKFKPIEQIRADYEFNSRSKYSVPPAIEAFFEADDYESCIRRAISLGGDSDTIAAIAGGIAEAYYGGVPENILDKGKFLLNSGMKKVLNEFSERYIRKKELK